jgi:3-oxoacyl-[acyl-carrier protein] reductase
MNAIEKTVRTGGTGAIGRAICVHLAESGWTVAVGYRSRPELAVELAASLGGLAVPVLVHDSRQLAATAEEVQGEWGRLDALVNNAGTTRFVPHDDLDTLDDELFDEIMVTNVRGPFACIRAFRALLEKSRAATVVNLSSLAARTGTGSNVAYCASKAALESVSRSLGRALAPTIRTMCVAPGLVDSGFIVGADPQWRAEQVARTPLGRMATPDDVADAVVACLDRLRFSTGGVVAVDGGRALG